MSRALEIGRLCPFLSMVLGLGLASIAWEKGPSQIRCWAVDDPVDPQENPLTARAGKASLIATRDQLHAIVKQLSENIGERNLGRRKQLDEAADYLQREFEKMGYPVERQTYEVQGHACHNLIAEIKGIEKPEEVLVVGAHYDSASDCPGANDNASGVASMTVIADRLSRLKPKRTLRFVAFTNEEPPYFQREGRMGSWVYARECKRKKERLLGVISLETMGYYRDEANSQKYPALIASRYPTTGNFIGFVSDLNSRTFLKTVVDTFRKHSSFPSEEAFLPSEIQGVGWSDHWSFWQEGYRGLMVTDTAPFRYPHYHLPTDTLDKIDFDRLSEVVTGLTKVVEELVTQLAD